MALQHFGHAGGGGVFGKFNGQLGERLHIGLQVNLLPTLQHLRGIVAQQVRPFVHGQRGGEANANRARPGRLAHQCADLRQPLFNAGQHHGRVRVGVMKLQPVAHLAGEVRRQHLQAAAANLQPQAESAVRIERQGHRRLADLAANAVLLDQQVIAFQPADDDGHRLR